MTVSIPHYTIETGHVRHSPRSEVSDDVIAMLQPLLVDGRHDVPGQPGYSVSVSAFDGATTYKSASGGRVFSEGKTLIAAILRGQEPLLTAFVCVDEPGVTAVLEMTGAKLSEPFGAPCLIVSVAPALYLDQEAQHWTPDFERCLAWAWIEKVNE